MLVKINSYALLNKTYEEFKAAKEGRDAESREAARKMQEINEEAAAAQAALDDLIDRDIAGEDLAAEIAQAKSRVTVAEAKKSRIESKQQPAVTHVKPKFGFLTVDTEIRNQIGDGRIFEAFQPELGELNELREQYRKKAQAVLVKMHQVNKELSGIHDGAARMEGELTGNSVNTRPAPQLTESDFKAWMWVDNDLSGEMYTIRKLALQAANPEHALQPVRSMPDASKAGMSESGMTGEEWIKFNQNLVRG